MGPLGPRLGDGRVLRKLLEGPPRVPSFAILDTQWKRGVKTERGTRRDHGWEDTPCDLTTARVRVAPIPL